MLSFQHHHDPPWAEGVLDGIGHLVRQPLLDLQAAGAGFEGSGQLAQSHDATLGRVANVRDPAERQKMVLAHGGEGDITQDHRLLVALLEGDIEVLPGVGTYAGEQLRIGVGNPVRRGTQPLSSWILADGGQQLRYGPADSGFIYLWHENRAFGPPL